MEKQVLSGMNKEQLSRFAVAYLIRAKEERPDGLEKAFGKLEKYEGSMREIVSASNEAKKTIAELEDRMAQMYGSINAIVELIAEDLPEDKIPEWCEKYTPPADPGAPKQRQPDISMPGGAKMKTVGEMDVAGSTAKELDPTSLETAPTP